ncbi:MAG: hypothetical protein ACRDWD_09745 [Acidimicrobiia bacterium]
MPARQLEPICLVTTRLRAFRLVDLPAMRSFDFRRGVELVRRAAATVE